jgi:subtilisin family serine protease
MRRSLVALAAALSLAATSIGMVAAAPSDKQIHINVALNVDISGGVLAELGSYGRVIDTIESIDAVTMKVRSSKLEAIRALPFVAGASPDAERTARPIDPIPVADFSAGLNTWDLDAVNVTDFGVGRTEAFDGAGVYVAVLDTGLVSTWRWYFPEERIATQFGAAFGGGGMEQGNVSMQPNKWERDTHTHGTHVTSTVIGYSLGGTPINGVAPNAAVIPVKVLNQNGSGWSSTVAAGITYVADLKNSGALGTSPVVINMSLGGPELDTVEQVALDYAIASGVIVVASAGNAGEAGMGFPGAYPPVISAGASGWVGEWTDAAGAPFVTNWWVGKDVADPTDPDDFYITTFSSRELAGQELDVVAPGSWVVGPFQLQRGQPSYFFLGGTSMASPHVAGIAALLVQKNGGLAQAQVEAALTGSAIPLDPGCRSIFNPNAFAFVDVCWGADATGAGLATADAALSAVAPGP